MSSLESLYVQKNQFTGPLPPIWFTSSAAWKQLVFLDIRWNNLIGILPEPSHGSNFRQDRLRTPRIYAEPMNPGFGMCGAVPADGPRVLSYLEDNMKPNISDGTRLLTFSVRCGPGGGYPISLQFPSIVLRGMVMGMPIRLLYVRNAHSTPFVIHLRFERVDS
jgi:hypothetical protein